MGAEVSASLPVWDGLGSSVATTSKRSFYFGRRVWR